MTAGEEAADVERRVPKLIAFDLDGTIWWPEMYMLDGGAPFTRDAKGRVHDARGEQVRLMGDSAHIFQQLATDPAFRNTLVAYVSRTEYPEWALPCLRMFPVEGAGVTLFDMGAHKEIYPGSKVKHFKAIHKVSGIDFEDMLFFDNERWNLTDVAPLGVHCVYTPRGMTLGHWNDGLAKYAAAPAAAAAAAAGGGKRRPGR